MSHTVVAELVAAVMKVEVTVGQRVAAEDAVVILESMKMEIPVLAEVAGVVSEIVVADGDVVNDGDPLVVIEPRRAERLGDGPLGCAMRRAAVRSPADRDGDPVHRRRRARPRRRGRGWRPTWSTSSATTGW